MRRRALFMGGKEKLPLIIRVDTTKSGATPSDTFRIPANAPGETYRFKVDWGDGVITSNHTGNAEHTYAIGGVYDIKIYRKFPRMFFNNSGDRLKLLEVRDWGELNYSTNQTGAFYGCNNLTFIAEDENSWYNGITNGISMFRGSSLTSLPDNMTLSKLTNGGYMFPNNSFTSLPDNMTLSSLTIGSFMFYNNSLTSLPDVMTLSSLTNGSDMFLDNLLTTLPDGMLLSSLTNGNSMFRGNLLNTLPDGMTLGSLTVGTNMFRDNPITSAIGLNLHKINSGASFMNSANLPNYSEILIDIEANNPNDDVMIHFGGSKYNSSAVTARANLVARGWDITDGGLE